MPTLRALKRIAFASLFLPLTASAQGLVSTGATNNGVNDLRWTVATGLVSGPLGAFAPAFLVDIDPTTPGYQIPGPWQPNNVGTYQWIGAFPTATVPQETRGDGTSRYQYRYMINFTQTSPLTIQFMCAVDNAFVSYQLNGGSAVTSGCNTFSFGAAQTITPGAGANTLLVSFNGDGVTDGLLVNVAAVTPTPEPATMALLATGLAGLAGVVRRRRRTS